MKKYKVFFILNCFILLFIAFLNSDFFKEAKVCYSSREEIKTMLNDPGSAVFSDCGKSFITTKDEKYHFYSNVKARNAFGGMVSKNFACDVYLSPKFVTCKIY